MKTILIMVARVFLVAMICISANYSFSELILVPDQKPTIQAAVDSASNGDVIYVRLGPYLESVNVFGFASLTIKAEGGVIVNPPNGKTAGFHVMSDGVTIDGFEIAGTDIGIRFEGSFNVFSNNYIHDVTEAGIGLWDFNGGSNYNVIRKNVIEDVDITAILLHGPYGPGGAGNGLNTGNIVIENKIRFARQGGISIANAENTTIVHNTLNYIGNGGIDLSSQQSDNESNYNTIAHNLIDGVHTSELQPSAGIALGGRGYCVQNNIHHNEIKNITNADINRGSYGILLGDSVKENLIHHNIVVICFGLDPYWNTGLKNRDYKNSWN